MSLPASQSFTDLQGSLGTGSVTFDGLTFFSDDASAVISVTAGHQLSFGTSTGTHVVGYKTADGSNFSPTGGNGLGSFSVYTLGSYVVELFRDGVLVGGTGFTTTSPSFADVSWLSTNIDEIRFTYTNNNLILDDLNIANPVRTANAAPVIAAFDGDEATYVEGASAVILDQGSNALLTDDSFDLFENGTLVVTITQNFAPGEDVLGIAQTGVVSLSAGYSDGSIISVSGVPIGKIAAGWSGANGESLGIIFADAANATNIQALIRALTYENTVSTTPSTLDRTVHIALTDGNGGTTTASINVDVVGVADVPTANTDSLFLSRGAKATFDLSILLENDTTQAGLSLSVTGIGPADTGTVSMDGNGHFIFNAPGSGDSDSFTYVLSNGDASTSGVVNATLLATTKGKDTVSVPTAAGEFSYIDGRQGSDTITGGDGTDILLGSKGSDKLLGGNGLDTLSGGAQNDKLSGGAGNDRLFGGAGADKFIFDTALDAANNVDLIDDFKAADEFRLSTIIFTEAGPSGRLHLTAFLSNTTGDAGDASDRIIYNEATGELHYDFDGSGAGASILFAVIGANLHLNHSDFVIF